MQSFAVILWRKMKIQIKKDKNCIFLPLHCELEMKIQIQKGKNCSFLPLHCELKMKIQIQKGKNCSSLQLHCELKIRDAKSGRCGRYICAIFFSAGANFWAILGNFWAILGHLGSFWVILGHYGPYWVIFGLNLNLHSGQQGRIDFWIHPLGRGSRNPVPRDRIGQSYPAGRDAR